MTTAATDVKISTPAITPPVEDSALFLRYVKERRALMANAPEPVPPVRQDLPESWSLEQYQTPFQNQGPRGTCWAFAAAAALEAAYKRDYGITLHLSEEYIFHAEKTVGVGKNAQGDDLDGPRETNCSYWGGQGASDVLLVMSAYAIPEAAFAPYLADVETLRINIPSCGALPVGGATQEQIDAFEYSQCLVPIKARWNAKYRVLTSKTVWAGSGDVVSAIQAEIANGREVVIGLIVGKGGDDDLQGNPAVGGHVTLVVGYDNNLQRFQIKNSWFAPVDPVTQQPTYSWLSYTTARTYITDAHCITSIADPNQVIEVSAAWHGLWNMDHDGWQGTLVIRRDFNFANYFASQPGQPNTLPQQQNSVRLGSYYAGGLRHDVNGHFENGGSKMVYFVADGTSHVPSGQETGQRFEAYLFSRDFTNAAGQTTWENTPFGVVLSRNCTPGLQASFTVADWQGAWAMSFDGWPGTLQVTVTNSLVSGATYVAANGTQFPATASLAPGDPHTLSVTIEFSAALHQLFTVFAHTHEKGVFSGTTTQNGATYGVQGFKIRPIYFFEPSGGLAWYMHIGRLQGSVVWGGPTNIGTGWNNGQKTFAGGDGIIYAIETDGSLIWYRHLGEFDGSASFAPFTKVGTGWRNPSKVIGAGKGIIYAIETDGSLYWYRHDGYSDGSANWTGPIKVDAGWDAFQFVFSGGNGIIYGVKPDGTLVWRRHYGHADGSSTWSAPVDVGTGWQNFIHIFCAEAGVMYAVEPNGVLLQYVHTGYFDGSVAWVGAKQVGTGWQNCTDVFVS